MNRISKLLPCLILLAAVGEGGLQPGFLHAKASPVTQKNENDAKSTDEGADGLSLKAARRVEYTTSEGTWMSLDVAPDGKSLIFDLVGHLYKLPLGGGQAIAITDGWSFDSQPRFSPDGRQIAYVSDRSGSNNVWISDANGSNPRRLTADENALFVSPAWTPDGRYVVVSRMKPHAYLSSMELWMYDVRGGSGLQVDQTRTGDTRSKYQAMGVVVSPDGHYLYYEVRQSEEEFGKWQLVRRNLHTGDQETITNDQGGAFRPLLSPDGETLVYATHYDAGAALRLRNLKTGEERWLNYPIQRDSQESGVADRDLLPGYAFTPDGANLVIAYDGKIRRIDLKTGQEREIPFEAEIARDLGPRLNFQGRVEQGPVEARLIQGAVESPDGAKLVFSSLGHLYGVATESGAKPKRLTSAADREFEPAWSPDGRWICYVTWSAELGGAVWRIASDGGAPERLTNVVGYYTQPAWSPDGSHIVVLRAPRSMALEQQDQWLRPIDGLELVAIPSTGGSAEVISPAAHFTYPHFAGPDQRLFVTQLEKPNLQNVNYSLVSMRADGTDREVVVKLTAKNIWGSDFSPPAKMEVAGNCQRVLALFRSQVYLFDLPMTGGTPPTIDLSSPAVAVSRLTDVGADFVSWADRGKTISWSLGATYFRVPLAQAEARDYASASGANESPLAANTVRAASRLKPEALRVSVQIPRAATAGTVVLRGARVITMKGAEVLDSADIVIHNERIQSVMTKGAEAIPRGAKIIDVSGTTIVPGFIDTHAHWFNIKRGVLDLENWDFLATLAYGITSGRDPQTYTSDIFAYQDLADAGEIIGPRAFSTGPGIFSTNDFQSEAEAEKIISRYKDYYRTDLVKSYEVGDRRQRQFVVEACQKLQVMPTTEGGAEMPLDLTHVIDGFGGNEHQFPIARLYSDVIGLVAQSGIYYTPTFVIGYYDGPGSENHYFETTSIYDNPKLRRFVPRDVLESKTSGLEWFRKDKYSYPVGAASAWAISKAGGKVSVGGHGELQGLSFHWQLWSLQAGGMSNLEALRAATLNGAEAIGLAKDLGSIEPGKLADLVVLDKNPLQDIQNTTSIRYVMKNGELFEGDTLNEIWPGQRTAGPYWWWKDHP